MIAVYILLGLLILVGALLICPMQFGVHYKKTASFEKFYVYVSFFGILFRIPINTKAEGRKKTKNKLKEGKREFSLETFKKSIDNLGEVVRTSKNELLDMLHFVREHLKCKIFNFEIAFGTGDAAKTGISTGIVWTSGTFLLKIIDSLIGIKNIKMNVYPDFTQKKFEIYLKTILIMSPIHFIIVVKRIKKSISFIKTKFKNI